ncbi:MAG: hypothetical protein ACI8W8_000951 [Rhodothermales bacterium]|jgi:hypothetical protein
MFIRSCLILFALIVPAAELRFAGTVGNSGAHFAAEAACGMGPVIDAEGMIWERAGRGQLNRYSQDGRLLSSVAIPNTNHRLQDQMTRIGDHILMRIGRDIQRLDGERLGQAESMSAGSFEGRVAILHEDQLFWLDAESAERTLILRPDPKPRQLFVADDGTIYGFGGREVYAWKDGVLLTGFPRPFRGDRAQKIGDFWYTHGWHGSINRFNTSFEPDPGVVLGGASGSFIGYLPESSELTHGTGLAQIGPDLFAISGIAGVVQLLKWEDARSRFRIVRRIGALHGLPGLALDSEGNIWTPRGAWRWDADSATPASLGDVQPLAFAQPLMVENELVLVKKHYNYNQLVRGPIFDTDGLSHFETRELTGVNPSSLTGAAPVGDNRGTLVDREGKFWSLHIGQRKAEPLDVPPVPGCTSLAWIGGKLHTATDRYIHSDGIRLATAWPDGRVTLHDADGAEIARYEGLDAPTHIAVAGDRVAVYESGTQRIVKLQLGVAESAKPARLVLPAAEFAFSDADFLDIGRPGGIPIAIAVNDSQVAVRAPGEVTIGVGDAMTHGRQIARPPGNFRFAAFVKLPSQQERVGFVDNQPIHAPFSANSADWAPFDLDSYRELAAERKAQIRISWEQPISGKASIVIEDAAGKRRRNLLSGRKFQAGPQTVIWDGLDESGKLVAPGDYSWRGIAHPGIRPEFRMSFAGGREPVNARPWGPNHGLLHHAVANDEHVFFAGPVTEGGWAIMALHPDGKFVQGYEHQQGFGIGHNAIAVDERYLYCAQDGYGWGQRDGETWDLTVARYDLKTGKPVEFPGKRRAFVADTAPAGGEYSLGGIAVTNGRIYVGSRDKKAILVFDAESAEPVDRVPMSGLRALIADFAITDAGLVRWSGERIVAGDFAGLAAADDGIWVSQAQQVHRYSLAGELLETLGTPGGPYAGVYDPKRLVNPAGLAIGPKGKLWVTEKRWNPKRIHAWDLEAKAVVYEKFGIPHYGGDGSGFDPENPRRWIGLGCLWDVEIAANSAKPTHIMGIQEGHFEHYHPQGYSFFREAGRTFLCTRGKIALILELLDNGTTRPIAAACGTHHFAYGCEWKPPQAYIDAFYAKWPQKRKDEKPGRKGQGKPWAGRVAGVLWVDRNADGETQAEEFSFTDEGVAFADGAWGHRQDSLSFRFPMAKGEQVSIASIAPKGFLANGIPDYPSLSEASSLDISLTRGYQRQGVSTAADRFGRFVFNSSPEMNAYGPDGAHLWSYPNQWSNVHGSHKAPLPQTGVMQGTMAFLGMAPLDDKADVFFLNGNHGRCFLMSSDGIYLDEAFTDVRVSYLKSEYRLGGEIFGGMFDRARDGSYYVQIGHGPYRIYQLHGIDKTQRLAGSIAVTAAQVTAAEHATRRQFAAANSAKTFRLPGEIAWDQSGKFKVKLRAEIADESLHLTYRVQDPSPWKNAGRDWTTLFATGDSVDLQIAADSAADPKRRTPVEGDQRLLIAPFEGEAIAVLYQHVKPGGSNPIEFSSPWRGARVDHVQRLADVSIAVKTRHDGYEIDARIPLSALNLKPSTVRADFGVTFGDAAGTETQLRSYWANPATMLVDDIPGEIMLHPNLWGDLVLE